MSQERLMKILLGPCISEKASRTADTHRQIVFKVLKDANKIEIKQAVELLFGVKVDAVRVVNIKAKQRRVRQVIGTKKAWKKAYVSLQEGYDINFAGTE